jgi:hypothetical protein
MNNLDTKKMDINLKTGRKREESFFIEKRNEENGSEEQPTFSRGHVCYSSRSPLA